MKSFTYHDYIKDIHTLKRKEYQKVEEGEILYEKEEKIKEENKRNRNKKAKEILKNKKEMVHFLNDFLEPKEEIKENDLVRCLKFNDLKMNYKNSDLIYYLKSQRLIFYIEEEKEIDEKVKQNMLNKCIRFMQEYIVKYKYKDENKYPIIIPILIYTGEKRLEKEKNKKDKIKNRNQNQNQKQNKKQNGNFYTYINENEEKELKFEFNIIDINKYRLKYLVEKNTMFTFLMMLEKNLIKT